LFSGLTVLALGFGAVWLWSLRWLETGREQLESRRYRDAEQTLISYLRWHPGSSRAHYLLGFVYGEMRAWEQALQQFQQVPIEAAEGKEALWRIGDVSLMLNRASDTEAALRRSLQLEPKSLEARRGLIALYRWQDRELDAEPLVWEAYELTPPNERPLLMAEWFRLHFAERPTADTYRRLSSFLAAQPDDLQSAVALGRWYVRQRQLGQARALLERVFLQFPGSLDARVAWSSCLLELGEWDRLNAVLADWPAQQQDLRYWRVRGQALQDFSGDYAAAADAMQRWLVRFPDDWQVRHRVSTCLRHLGRTSEAETEAARSEQLKGIVKYEVVDEILSTTLRNLHRPEHRERMAEFYRSVGYEREADVWHEMAAALQGQSAAQ
jgi:tetratricopeptide (TPR) repeat protein